LRYDFLCGNPRKNGVVNPGPSCAVPGVLLQRTLRVTQGLRGSRSALRRHAEHLRERERRHSLNEGRGTGSKRERQQQLRASLSDDIVNQVLGGGRQDEAGQTIDEHQRQPQRQAAAPRPDQRFGLLPRGGGQLLLAFGGCLAVGLRGGASVSPGAFRLGELEPHTHGHSQ
jgi:hypothetical protein